MGADNLQWSNIIKLSNLQIFKLSCQYLNDLHPLFTDALFFLDRFIKRYIIDFIVYDPDKNIVPSFKQRFHCMISHSACDEPVETTR